MKRPFHFPDYRHNLHKVSETINHIHRQCDFMYLFILVESDAALLNQQLAPNPSWPKPGTIF